MILLLDYTPFSPGFEEALNLFQFATRRMIPTSYTDHAMIQASEVVFRHKSRYSNRDSIGVESCPFSGAVTQGAHVLSTVCAYPYAF